MSNRVWQGAKHTDSPLLIRDRHQPRHKLAPFIASFNSQNAKVDNHFILEIKKHQRMTDMEFHLTGKLSRATTSSKCLCPAPWNLRPRYTWLIDGTLRTWKGRLSVIRVGPMCNEGLWDSVQMCCWSRWWRGCSEGGGQGHGPKTTVAWSNWRHQGTYCCSEPPGGCNPLILDRSPE